MKIWIVSELFYPEENATGYILTHIANALTKKYEVHVICGPANYGGETLEMQGSKDDSHCAPVVEELLSVIHLHRLNSKGYNKNILLSRLKYQLGLSLGLRKMLKKNLSPGDLVLMVTNPAPLLLMLPKAVKKRGNKLLVLVHDVFPENLIPAGIVKSEKSLIYRFLKRLFNKAYRRADKLLALGRDMQEILINKLGKNPNNTKVVVVENWAEDKLIVPYVSKSSELGQVQSLLTIQFAGNLGRVQGLDYFLQLFKEADNENLIMSFWGDGAIKKDLIQYHLDNSELKIEFNEKYTRTQQNEVLNKADLSLITLADGMYGLGVPSKSYNIMAAGKPILFIGNFKSEIARVVQENGIGFCFEPSDREGIVGFLKNLSLERKAELEEMGKQARHLAETVYSQEIILSKYVSEIQ